MRKCDHHHHHHHHLHHQVQPGLEAVHEKARQLERSQLQPRALTIGTSPEATEEDAGQLLGEPGATASWLAHVEEVDILRIKFTGGLAAQVCVHCAVGILLACVAGLSSHPGVLRLCGHQIQARCAWGH